MGFTGSIAGVGATMTPHTSRGVTITLDWVSWTGKYVQNKQEYAPLGRMFETAEVHPVGPVRPYDNALRAGPLSVYWHSEHPEWKILYTMTGADLREYREAGGEDRGLLQGIRAVGGRFTRIDVAIDLIGDMAGDVLEVVQAMENGWCDTTVKKVSHVHETSTDGIRQGATVYLGSRQSKRMLRVYDKGAQLNTPEAWTRIELECRKRYAERVGARMAEIGLFVVQGEIASFIETGLPWFDDAMQARAYYVPIVMGRKETDFDTWVMAVALPNVIKAIRMGNQEIAGRLRVEIDKLRGDGLYW